MLSSSMKNVVSLSLFLAIVRIDFSPVEGFQPGRFLTYQP
jgi:hypothetical protein